MQNESGGSGQNDSQHNDQKIDEEIDEYELYYGIDAVDEPRVERPVQSGPLSRRPSFSSSIPLFAMAIMFVLCTYTFNYIPYSDLLWASRASVFTKHEYWRLFTAIFTHADTLHLLSNIPLFFFFGLFLYEYFGFVMFPVLPLLIGAGANVITLYFYPDTVRLVGASGMVYGMVSLWLILYIYHDTGRTIPMRIFRSIAFTLIVLFPTTYDPATSYMVHAVGFFIGIICALMVLPFARVKIRES